MRKCVFASAGRSDRTFRTQDCYLTVRLTEDKIRADLVENQQVAALARKLGSAQIQQRLSLAWGFRGEADQDLARVSSGLNKAGEYVDGLDQRQLQTAIRRLLDLGLTGGSGREVGWRRHVSHCSSVRSSGAPWSALCMSFVALKNSSRP